MNRKQAISVPVVPAGEPPHTGRVARGGLASGQAPSAKMASQSLDAVTLDADSLARTVDAVQEMASEIKARAGKGVSLSEVQLEVGVSATGKVGILGIGADLQCAAKVQLKFKIDQ